MPSVRVNVSDDIRSDVGRFVPIGLFCVLAFLYVCFRQLRGVLLPFSVVVMSVVVAMGLIPVFGWKVQMVTVVLPVILLAVANDYGIHLMAKLQEANTPGSSYTPAEMAVLVVEDLGTPVLAAGITTIAGLLCLTTHIIVPAAQLGVLAAIGVGFALLCSLMFIPAVLAVLPLPEPVVTGEAEEGSLLDRALTRVAGFVAGAPKLVIAAVTLFTVGSAAGLGLLQVDTNPVNYYPSSSPVAVTSDKINRYFGGSTEVSLMVEGDIKSPEVMGAIDAVSHALSEQPQVGYHTSIAGVVASMHEAVLGEGHHTIPDDRDVIAQLFLLLSSGSDPEDFERMVDFDHEHALITVRVNNLSTQEIAAVVQAAEQARDEHMAGMNTTIGGFGYVFAELVDAVVEGQVVSLGLSLVLVLVLVAMAFRSPVAGVFAVLPLAMAMPVLFGLMGYLGIELNIVTAMLSSIMIGVGVDYTIHFLWRYRSERAEGLQPEQAVQRTLTTAGRGIVFNALSVVVGFAVLLISNFLPVKFFGFLVVVSISACLVGALALLPALVLLVRPAFLEPS
jgi:hydrophobe/amphiphile efflux-3 (HAE3) family protein